MGSKYRGYQTKQGPSEKELQRVHPVWRGVGFALLILMPVIAWAAADVLINSGLMPLPRDLFASSSDFIYGIIPDRLIYIRLALFAAILLVLYGLLTFVTFLMNRMFGINRRNDPFYVPPVPERRRRR